MSIEELEEQLNQQQSEISKLTEEKRNIELASQKQTETLAKQDEILYRQAVGKIEKGIAEILPKIDKYGFLENTPTIMGEPLRKEVLTNFTSTHATEKFTARESVQVRLHFEKNDVEKPDAVSLYVISSKGHRAELVFEPADGQYQLTNIAANGFTPQEYSQIMMCASRHTEELGKTYQDAYKDFLAKTVEKNNERIERLNRTNEHSQSGIERQESVIHEQEQMIEEYDDDFGR